jgi:hypothetical protein
MIATSKYTVFRKSTNTNSFGLRGYWTHHHNIATGLTQLHSFATSHDLNIGDTITDPYRFELPRLELQLTAKQWSDFNAQLNQPA